MADVIAQTTAAQKSKEKSIAAVSPQLNVFIELLIIICPQKINNSVGYCIGIGDGLSYRKLLILG